MNNESASTRSSIAPRVIGFVFDYICYIPLTYVVLYCLTLVIVLVAGSSYESASLKFLLFVLGVKGSDAVIDGQVIMRSFFFWWLLFGTILQVLKWIFHLDFIKGILISLSLLALFGTAALIIKTGSSFVPLVLLILFVANLFIYHALNRGLDKFQSNLKKSRK